MHKRFPAEFQRDVVAVARRGGLSRAGTAADFGISETTLNVSAGKTNDVGVDE